ncbi:hypothetical protein GM610_26695 (plasmid) [Bacillus tropicus]|uniref:hypothetical protein n=1 Tax=Bacillus tropicus TaxID=2026188 RepID=UPI0013DFECA8|nr:hypothetical protein [Bacillus tropicus]QIE40434.1 hypothetical protein GM610_26695 [Bacillus tropicus]
MNQFKSNFLTLLQATASTNMATRPVFGDLEKTKNSPPYENLSTWSILQLSAITFADQYRIIKDLYQDVCVSSDALFELTYFQGDGEEAPLC